MPTIFDFSEPLTKLPSHRILALFRGEKEEVLDLDIADAEEPRPGALGWQEARIAQALGVADRGRPATASSSTPCDSAGASA